MRILILGEGITSRHALPGDADATDLDTLKRDARAFDLTGAALGTTFVFTACAMSIKFE